MDKDDILGGGGFCLMMVGILGGIICAVVIDQRGLTLLNGIAFVVSFSFEVVGIIMQSKSSYIGLY